MGSPSKYLLKKRNFLPLFVTQFFGAFNDNAFKLSMLTLISYHLSHNNQNQSEYYQAWASALYTLPFFLFSATAGQMADKFDKAKMSRWIKVFECFMITLGSFALVRGNIFSLMITLLGLGIHSTFFGPIKYSILPDHLLRQELLAANALIEASTFLAILLGTTLGSLSIGALKAHVNIAVVLINISALIGLLASLFIPKAPSKIENLSIDLNLWRATKKMIKFSIESPRIFLAIFAISWFWLIGAVMLTKLPDYVHYVLNANTSIFAIYSALFSLGIALGSMIISYLLAGQITLKYVPLTMLLLSFFWLDLYWASPRSNYGVPLFTIKEFFANLNNVRITLDFFLFSLCAGLFIVPLYTYLQISSNQQARARTIAANNIFNALFMVVGSIIVMALLYFNVGIALIFLLLAMVNILVVIILWILITLHADYSPVE